MPTAKCGTRDTRPPTPWNGASSTISHGILIKLIVKVAIPRYGLSDGHRPTRRTQESPSINMAQRNSGWVHLPSTGELVFVRANEGIVFCRSLFRCHALVVAFCSVKLQAFFFLDVCAAFLLGSPWRKGIRQFLVTLELDISCRQVGTKFVGCNCAFPAKARRSLRICENQFRFLNNSDIPFFSLSFGRSTDEDPKPRDFSGHEAVLARCTASDHSKRKLQQEIFFITMALRSAAATLAKRVALASAPQVRSR
jgi:hypothetical protein